jgi:PAS domain S-box-containing protein
LNISLTVSPVRDATGRIIGASKIARDITAEVRAQAEAAEQRERLTVTLHSIGDAVIATNRHGQVAYMNPVAEDLTGWPAAEAAGRPLEEVFRIVNEESRQTVENPVVKVLRDGSVVGLANHTVLIARGGREMFIHDSAAPIRDARGEIMGVVLIFRDVTEERSAQKTLAAQTAELRRANEDLNQFAYAVSHDLREPLRNIGNYAELLVRKYAEHADEDSERFRRFILDGVARMEALLNDLLTYSQLGGPQQQPAALVDCNELLEKTRQNLTAAIAESRAVITSDPLPRVLGYEMHLLQLLQNLIGNAIKYRSGQIPRVHVRVRKHEGEWLFSVIDNGIGIEPQYLHKIFGVFKRLHGKAVPGTGIGLAICTKVVERHGGRIWVESEPGQGSEFFFTLPIAAEGAASAGT